MGEADPNGARTCRYYFALPNLLCKGSDRACGRGWMPFQTNEYVRTGERRTGVNLFVSDRLLRSLGGA